MKPEDYLAFIEGANSFMDGITHIKNGLVDRGWSTPAAEVAARELFAGMLAGATR